MEKDKKHAELPRSVIPIEDSYRILPMIYRNLIEYIVSQRIRATKSDWIKYWMR